MQIKEGRPYPLGATVTAEGVNFSIFSAHAKVMHLLLFDSGTAPKASQSINLEPATHRTGHYWHIELCGLHAEQVYAYRAEGVNVAGPSGAATGTYFDREKVLLDPYSKAVCTELYSRTAASANGDNEATCLRSVVVDTSRYDWEGDLPLGIPFHRTVLYEMHVAGFTRHPNSGVSEAKRGTYAGLIEKIPYLVELGITAIELMPVFAFDAQDAKPGLENYWGYSPISFFAPHPEYSVGGAGGSPLACLDEFRDMVKALHRAGLEVILDVVYNHTAEAGSEGPTFCFKGLDAPLYYMLSADRSRFSDYTGTGNTLNVNQSIVRRMIVDSLRYWVAEMHVDGFRFDLASVLTRDETGLPVGNAPIVWDIDSDPVLAGAKLMAEAWDAGGLYQVGTFSKDRWKDWNGRFRDDVRSFIRSDRSTVRNLGYRLLGSPDLYTQRLQPPEQSINFVTCHDGFTLNDLVSYNTKRNEANGEANRDGSDGNLSWNCGVEGPTDDLAIEALRERQMRNAFTLTLLSIGTPFLLMGDEVRRTQRGNNNAYCQNNEVSWFDWELVTKNAGLRRFVSVLIHIRRNFGEMLGASGSLSLHEMLEQAVIDWHGVKLHQPDLGDDSHTLSVTAYLEHGPAFHLMMNAYWEPLAFAIPGAERTPWFRIIDTFLPSPLEILDNIGDPLADAAYIVQPRSIVLLGTLSHTR